VITHTSTVTVYVSDQDKALDFYVNKLGFEKRADNPMGPGAPRWIEVAPPGAQTAILLYKPTQSMPGASTYERALSSIGTMTTFIFNVDDMQATCRELESRGVEFAEKPRKQPYGWWATIKDADGNMIGLHQ
jgi:predicted enzyme related to lactoylglutathione lyase